MLLHLADPRSNISALGGQAALLAVSVALLPPEFRHGDDAQTSGDIRRSCSRRAGSRGCVGGGAGAASLLGYCPARARHSRWQLGQDARSSRRIWASCSCIHRGELGGRQVEQTRTVRPAVSGSCCLAAWSRSRGARPFAAKLAALAGARLSRCSGRLLVLTIAAHRGQSCLLYARGRD